MGAPTNTPSTGEIWHLSVDDLLAPLPDRARLGGPGPFVINLSASTAPIAVPKGVAGCQHAHVYQVQRMEDRRPRYRLRLGPFANEDDAEAALNKVRDIYPGALTATADADDLRAIATRQAKADAHQSPAEKPAAPTVEPAKLSAQSPVSLPSIPKTGSPKPAAAPRVPPAMPTAEPMIPVLRLSTAVPTPSVPVPRQIQQLDESLPSLETTQTIRPLTQVELEDDRAAHWFVIQLSQAQEAFDPDSVPNLDIFSEYRLYSIAGIEQGRIVHGLRLGFFSEEIAARAVASYVAEFYHKPTVKRVSAAERERFAERPLEPRKDVGATGKHAVIEITSERYVRERRNAAVK
jgi:hypothetical protein